MMINDFASDNDTLAIPGSRPLLRPGQRVRHSREDLGEGVVQRVHADGRVTVWFDGRGKPETLFPYALMPVKVVPGGA